MSPSKDPLVEVAQQVRNWFAKEAMEEAIFRVESGGNKPDRTYLLANSRYGDLLRIKVTQNGRGTTCELKNCYFNKLPISERTKNLQHRLLAHINEQNENHWHLGGEEDDNPPTI
ncbi:MAG: hypothetical protein Q7T49_03065 [bacterium]|nr:hypothetical protein [bacterium]